MKLATRFGEIDVDPESCITMQDGLIGLPDLKSFCLISGHEASPISWLQCVDEPIIALPVMSPTEFFDDYSFDLQDADVAALELESPEDSVVLCTVTVEKDKRQVTTNLLGPIVINQKTRTAKQVILSSENYSPKRLLFELEKPGARRKSASVKAKAPKSTKAA